MYEKYKLYLDKLRNEYKDRKLPNIISNIHGYLDFASNDYLGLSKDQNIIQASIEASAKYGIGASGSRLLSGNTSLHEKLEKMIAYDKKTEAGIIFSSGFQANISTLSAILNQQVLNAKPLVFFDRLNHSSLYQAIFISSSQLIRYHHNNIKHLEEMLIKYQNDTRPKFIITETIFGMDGDIPDLERIIYLTRKYNALLYLDEAHATGLYGDNGYGISTTLDLSSVCHIIMGSFSKALGCMGGYIACSSVIKEYLINKAPGFIYSTAPSLNVIGAVIKAWQMIPELSKERAIIKNNSEVLISKLKLLGFDLGNTTTNIIPIILGNEKITLDIMQKLRNDNILVSAIRPPTVPASSARLRVAVNAKHTIDDIEKLVFSINKYYYEYGK